MCVRLIAVARLVVPSDVVLFFVPNSFNILHVEEKHVPCDKRQVITGSMPPMWRT